MTLRALWTLETGRIMRGCKKSFLQDLYKEVAEEMKIPIPSDDMKPFFVQADGGSFDPGKPDVALKYYAGLMKTKGGIG